MLKTMRSNAKIFMYILIIAFVVWLAADAILTGQRVTYVGMMFGKKISINEYRKAWEAGRTKAIFTYGDEFRKIANNLNLEGEAWDRLILLHEAKRQKLKTDDTEVVNFIKDIAVFKGKDGKLDRKTYERILQYTFGLTPRDFEEQIREELTIKKLIEKQNENAVLTDEEILNEYKIANEKAKCAYLLFKTDDYIPKVSCTENELKTYFDKNKQAFSIPEQVNVEHFGKNFSDETEETKNKVNKEMRGIYDEVSDKKDFEEIAKKYALQIKETGFFGREDKIPEIGWALNFANVALSLKPGEISKPIETKSGVYILRVKDKKQARPAEFAEVKEKVEKAVKNEKSEMEAKAKAKETLSTIKARVEKKEEFEDIIKDLSLSAKETDAFTRNTYIQGLGVAKEFIDAAFSLKEGEIYNEPIKVHNGYAILKLIALIPIDEIKYEEEKETFKERLLAQKKYTDFITWFFDLKKRANLKSNLEKQ